MSLHGRCGGSDAEVSKYELTWQVWPGGGAAVA